MHTDIELPRLSSSELVSQFGNDEIALRRYRMLVALIREKRTPGEVARTFGVSRESLRRLRQAFEREGISALQSRKRGGGHLAHATPLAVTIRQELRDNPGITASALWRRVNARLREDGLHAPRSTFYRLLARLRDEELCLTDEQFPISQLRDALNALAEDPPLALGRSELATRLFPDVREPLQRGYWLQHAMRTAIARLHPLEAGPVLDDPRWRHYLIIAGEYETGEKRATLQNALALSTSTYSRAKREALERLAILLPNIVRELPPPEPSAALIAPPPPPSTFDLEHELEQYMARLRHTGLALIWGPAGVGKLSLATTLAARLQVRGQKVVWHHCRPPDVEPKPSSQLLLTLAAALALDGWPTLWEMLRVPDATNLAHCLVLLTEALTDRHWTVIIANAHWLTGSEATRVLEVLTTAQKQQDMRLVLVSRNLVSWANPEHWPPLPLPNDALARETFLRRIAGEIPKQTSPRSASIGPLRDRLLELLTAIPAESLRTLPADQTAQALAALETLEQIARQLHPLHPPVPPATHSDP